MHWILYLRLLVTDLLMVGVTSLFIDSDKNEMIQVISGLLIIIEAIVLVVSLLGLIWGW